MRFFSKSPILCLSLLIVACNVQAALYTWDAGGGVSTVWSNPLNWVGDTVPTFTAGDTFNLTRGISSASSSTVDSNQTLGIINIGDDNNTHAWTLNNSGGAVLTLDNGGSNAQINQVSTSFGDFISVPLALKGNLDVSNATSNRTLTISGGITSNATSGTQTISIVGSGAGQVTISGAIGDGVSGGKVAVVVNNSNVSRVDLTANSYTGGTTLTAGKIAVATGSFGANGSALTINGAVTLGAKGTNASLNLGSVSISSDFSVSDAFGGARIAFVGAPTIDLNNGTRTITSNGSTSADLGGPLFGLNSSTGNINVSNGTLKFVGGTGATASTPSVLLFDFNAANRTVLFNNANLEIGANATTAFFINNQFGTSASTLPNVTVDANGALNLSESARSGNAGHSETIGALSGSGKVVNSAATAGTATLTINSSTDATFSGNIQNGGYNGQTVGVIAVIKTGTSKQTLSGANSYSGTTAINGGVLNIQNNTALGSTSGGTSVASGAALEIQNDITVGAEALSLNGTGISSGGAFRNVSGNNVWQGAVTLTGATRINSDSGSLTFNTASNSITATNQNLTLGGSGSGSVEGTITTGSGTVTKDGSGTWTFSGTNTYTGATSITSGTLLLAGSGSINNTSGIAVSGTGQLRYDSSVALSRNVTLSSGGTFRYNSGANYAGSFAFTNGTLGGTNWNGNLGGLTVGAGQILTPGNSAGTAFTTSQTWAGGGTYSWEINAATGTAGTDWDLISGSSGLTLTATNGSKFNLDIVGTATGFNSMSSYKWLIADFTGAITTFNASAFNIDSTGFTNPFGGTFGIARGDTVGGDSSQLYLTYTAVPEPNAWLLLGAGIGFLLYRRRRTGKA